MIKERQTTSFCGVKASPSAISALINRTLEVFRYELSESGVGAENDTVWVIELKMTEVQK